jgi:hypothetical protein
VSSTRRRRLLVARTNGGDVLAGEFVKCVWGGSTGFLKSIEPNGMGLVWWIKSPGHYEIIHTSLLRQAKARL